MLKKYLFILITFLSILSFQTLSSAHYLLMGAPGAGKGTLTQLLTQHDEFEHLCLGDLLRHEIAIGSERGRVFKKYVESGELVPQDMLFSLFEEYFAKAVLEEKNIIVDGMVQCIENVIFFDDLLERYELEDEYCFIYLKVSKEVALERLLSRMICSNCGKSYTNSVMLCETCGGDLVRRMDDNNQTIIKRVDRFFNSTIDLIQEYKGREAFFEFNGEKCLDELYKEYKEVLLNH